MDSTKQKEEAGGFASIAWLVSGLYLYLTTPGASLFSWSALRFFTVGMFAEAIVFGIVIYAIDRGVALLLTLSIGFPSPRAAIAIGLFGWVLLVGEGGLVFIGANWVFHQIETGITRERGP